MIREQVARAMGAHPWRERGRAWFTLALPALALVLTSFLLYQTAHTAASNRRIAREALRGHGSVAAWELSRHADHRLLVPVVGAFLGAHLSAPAGLAGITPRELGAAFRYPGCRCLGGVRSAFRVDLRDGAATFHHRVPAADSALAWVADTVRARSRSAALLRVPRAAALPPEASAGFVFPSRPGGLPPVAKRRSVVVGPAGAGALAALRGPGPDSFGMAVGSRSGAPSLVLFALVNDSAGRPLVALGVETEPAAFLGPVLAELVREVRLLPPTLAAGVPNDSVLAFAVMAGGRPLYASARLPEVVGAPSAVAPQLGALAIVAGVRPSYAGRLSAGNLAAPRVPLQIGMAVLAAALFAASLVLLRRERELYRMRAGFVTGVSHELRTPLAQIRLFAEILASGDEADADERRRFAGIVAEEAQRLTHLVETLLAFSRPGRARGGAQAVPVELGEEVERAIEAIRPLCERAGTRLRIARDAEVWAVADPLALRHILLNLIDNAAKYGPDAQTVTLHIFRRGERACIAVDDEGDGVPDAERERIFKPFHRMARHAEGPAGGSGIGLAVAREMAHQQHGSVRAESAPGGGARFLVELPLHSAPRPVAPRRERVAP